MMELVDSHAHLFLDEFKEDLSQVVERARRAGVTRVFMPNIDSSTLPSLLDVCGRYKDYFYPMVGLHPTSVNASYEEELAVVEKELAIPGKYVAVGEIGMDLYWDKTYLKEQRVALEQQLDWALQCDLPVVIHCREAFDSLYKIMSRYREKGLRGIFHSFTGTKEEAFRMLEFPDFYIGVNGVVTFKNSSLPSVLPVVPLDRMVLETDSPYLAPVPYRGKRNESAFLEQVARKVADVYGREVEEVAQVTSGNAMDLFRTP